MLRYTGQATPNGTVVPLPCIRTMYYYRYENAEVSCCYKYLMFSYNIIFWLAGAAFIAIGFWAWSEKGNLIQWFCLPSEPPIYPVFTWYNRVTLTHPLHTGVPLHVMDRDNRHSKINAAIPSE
ncbi:hypothetical protein GOODEAATRI_025778 [Goodea atripinnis]|uniref:Uncharacterized protein n=1 Tax=Goodea atripinnis TaxID=208336 RepID=A0ABV0P7T2_9TELE